jgi:hypothetical protein
LVPILKELEKDPNIDIFSPFGSLLVNIPLGDDDEDESQEYLVIPEVQAEDLAENPRTMNADIQVEVEESFSQLTRDSEASEGLAISPTVLIKGKDISKLVRSHSLASTERLQALLIASNVFSNKCDTQLH